MPLVRVPPMCAGCGACCIDFIVDVESGCEIPEELTEVVADTRIMRRTEDRKFCVALDPLTMRCTEYSRRPAVCRRFLRETGACMECVSRLSMSQLNQREQRVERVLKAAVEYAHQMGYEPTLYRNREGEVDVYLRKAPEVSTVSESDMQASEESFKKGLWESL